MDRFAPTSSRDHNLNYTENQEAPENLNSSSSRTMVNYTFENNENQTIIGKSPSVGRNELLANIELSVLVIIFILTVLGNMVVMFGIYFRSQKMSRMYYFILHLSIADLVTAFFNVLPQICWELTHRFVGGNILCKVVKFGQLLGPYSSSYLLIITALDRYEAICFPLRNCLWTARKSQLMLAGGWFLSLLLCVPQAFIFSYKEPWSESHPGIYDCWATFVDNWGAKAYVTWYSISVFIIPLVILIFAYSCICRTIWKSFGGKNEIRRNFSKKLASDKNVNATLKTTEGFHYTKKNSFPNPNSSFNTAGSTIERQRHGSLTKIDSIKNKSKKKKYYSPLNEGNPVSQTAAKSFDSSKRKRILQPDKMSAAKIKTIKLTVTVILCYIFCSSPFILAQLWVVYYPEASKSSFYTGTTFTIFVLLAPLNSCFNPWVFIFFNPNLLPNFLKGLLKRKSFLHETRNANQPRRSNSV